MSRLSAKISSQFWPKLWTLDSVPATYYFAATGVVRSISVIVEAIDEEAELLYASLTVKAEIGVFSIRLSDLGTLPEKGDTLTVAGKEYQLQQHDSAKFWKWADTTKTVLKVQGYLDEQQ